MVEETLKILSKHQIYPEVVNSNHIKVYSVKHGKNINFYLSTGKFHFDNEKVLGRGIESFVTILSGATVMSLPKSPEPKTRVSPNTLKYVKLRPDAHPPHKSYQSDAGVDLFAVEDVRWENIGSIIWTAIAKTGIALEIPEGRYLATAPRSSLLFKDDVYVFHSVLDCGYTGEVTFKLIHYGDNPPEILKGTKVAQVLPVVVDAVSVSFEQVEELPKHSPRGNNGFGHTGSSYGNTKLMEL